MTIRDRWFIVACTLLLIGLLVLTAAGFGVDSGVFAFEYVWFLLTYVQVTAPRIPWSIPAQWRDLHEWERSRDVHSRLGVNAFGRMLKRSFLRRGNTAVYFGHGQGVAEVRSAALAAEAAHFWLMLAFLPVTALALWNDRWLTLAWLLAFNTLMNVYPVLHLRMARGRLDRAGERQRDRGAEWQ